MKRWICYLLGHRWDLLPYEDAGKGWWIERHQCVRCGAHKRQLVAGQEG